MTGRSNGAGMFGGDVHLRAFADLQRSGLAPFLGRLGLDEYSRPLADVQFELVAIGTRSEASATRAVTEYQRQLGGPSRNLTPNAQRPPLSLPPDPDAVRRKTSPSVLRESWSARVSPAMSAANSGPRWLIIGRAEAFSTDWGTKVGPEICRFCGLYI